MITYKGFSVNINLWRSRYNFWNHHERVLDERVFAVLVTVFLNRSHSLLFNCFNLWSNSVCSDFKRKHNWVLACCSSNAWSNFDKCEILSFTEMNYQENSFTTHILFALWVNSHMPVRYDKIALPHLQRFDKSTHTYL